MKRNLRFIGIFVLVVSLSFIFVSGCAKKQVVKEEVLTKEEQATKSAEAVTRANEEALREKALKEEALREKALKEEALRERDILLKDAVAFKDIYFDFDKYDLKPQMRKILEQHAGWLIQHPEFEVVVEGHCDERGTREYNLALGERRAESTRNYLVTLGVTKGKLTTISYGEELPLDPSHTEKAWTKNRRAHFVVVTGKK